MNLFSVYNPSKGAEFALEKGNWFYIQKGDGNYRAFKISEWTEDELTEFVFYATASCKFTPTLNKADARAVAKALIEWAGDDTLIAVDEGDSERQVAEEFGLKFARKRTSVSRFDYQSDEKIPLTDAELLDEKKAILQHFDNDARMWEGTGLPWYTTAAYKVAHAISRAALKKRLGL